MIAFLNSVDWSPLFISFKAGLIATVIAFFSGLLLAGMVMRLSEGARGMVDSILTLPLVLPPTVAGFFLLLIFSLKRPFGEFLWMHCGMKVVLSFGGCVIAASVIAFPLMYRNARAAFEQVDITMIEAARTLGLSESFIFWRITVPIAAPGIISGTVLAFARAIGEYGATTMLAGNIKGKTQTIATCIASEVAVGNIKLAGFWVAVIMSFSFIILWIIHRVTARGKKAIKRW